MLGYADTICIEILAVFTLKIFDIGYKRFKVWYDVFQIALTSNVFRSITCIWNNTIDVICTVVYDKVNICNISDYVC